MSQRHHLARLIGEQSLHSGNFNKLAKEIAAYLLDSGQASQLDPLMRDIMNYRAEHGVIEVQTSSANKLSSQDISDIKALLKSEYPSARHFTVDQILEPDTIGGVKLDLPGEQLDLTIRAKVNKFKRLTSSREGA